MEDRPSFDKELNDEAIARVCACFDEMGLTLLERWHVCYCLAEACKGVMADHVREMCERIEAGDRGL